MITYKYYSTYASMHMEKNIFLKFISNIFSSYFASQSTKYLLEGKERKKGDGVILICCRRNVCSPA